MTILDGRRGQMFRRFGVSMDGHRLLSIATIIFLNLTERLTMAKYERVGSTAHKVRTFIRKNPNMSPKMVAETLSTNIDIVYYARKTLRKKAVKKTKPTQLTLPFAVAQKFTTFGKPKIRLQGTVDRSPEADMVNSPPHYTAGGVETIDFIEAKGLNYNLGNAVKYITRAGLKGDRVEDLKKAKWYIEREILSSHI
jgi:hypothetical protein